MKAARDDVCAVCEGQPRVVVAVAHPTMRALIVDLLARDHGCWRACAANGVTELADVVTTHPDLVVIDGADLPACRCGVLGDFPLDHVVVIGPEPDPAYRRAAFHTGAGGWVSRDDVADKLSEALRAALGCSHGPCPPGDDDTEASANRLPTR